MFASVDIGGGTTCCGVATGSGEMLAERIIPTLSHEGPDAVLGRISATLKDLAETSGHRLTAVGVGVPGLADFHPGRSLFSPTCPLDGVTIRWPIDCPPAWVVRSLCSTMRAWPRSGSYGTAEAAE